MSHSSDKLDLLERALRAAIDASPAAGDTIMDRRLYDRRINIDRRWQGQWRWIYITAPDGPGVPDDIDYGLFLGWYSDPPGEVFWEGRSYGDLAHAQELVTVWVIEGAPPEALRRPGDLPELD